MRNTRKGVKKLKFKTMKTLEKKLSLIFYKINFKSTPKMGGLKKLTCNRTSIEVDERNYYSGRGEKYNSTINHSYEEVVITQKLMNDLVRNEKLKLKKGNLVIAANKKAGCYSSLMNLYVKTNNFYVHHSYGTPLQLIYKKNITRHIIR